MLLDHYPELTKTFGQSNATPLITAATKGHIDVLHVLLSKDPHLLKIPRSNGKNALHLAARQGHVDVVKHILKKDTQLTRHTDKKGQTALHMAVKGVSSKVVRLLLGADSAIAMLPDKFGNTALHVATRKKRIEVLIFAVVRSLAIYVWLCYLYLSQKFHFLSYNMDKAINILYQMLIEHRQFIKRSYYILI